MTENSPSNEEAIGVYARTSTDEQEHGIDSQIHNCREHIPDDELHRVEIYKDEAVSGAKDDRPGFQRLKDDIDTGHVEKVYVSELSRISRNTLTLMEFLEGVFDDEIGLVVTDGDFPDIEPGNPFMKALGRMMAVLAELERDLTAARVERGLKRAREQGKWVGRPPKGFSTNDEGYLRVEVEEYLTVVKAIELVERGASARSVARAAGMSPQTLTTILNDEEKRALYARREPYRDEIDEALGEEVEGGSARVDFEDVTEQLTEIRAIVESAIDYDEDEVEQYVEEMDDD